MPRIRTDSFLSQWPKLRIERRVNLWRNIIVGQAFGLVNSAPRPYRHDSTLVSIIFDPENNAENNAEPHNHDHDHHTGNPMWFLNLGQSWVQWITEASALRSNGMPVDSFSLIVDGALAPDHASQIFDMVKACAAWQVAVDRWYCEKSLHPGILDRRGGLTCMSEIFPQAISDIIEDKSIVRCNFSTGAMYDPEQVLDHYRHLEVAPSTLNWATSCMWSRPFQICKARMPGRYTPFPEPLPSYYCCNVAEEVMADEGQSATGDI